jgi:beta-xylosidase
MTDKSFHYCFFVFFLLTSVNLAGQTFTNPVLHADYSDPDVCRVGSDYYLTASSFNCFPGLQILHSNNLVDWELIGAALVDYPGCNWDDSAPWIGLTPGQPIPVIPDANSWRTSVHPGEGVWAPSIRYHENAWYIFCGDPDRGIFMVKTEDPYGPWDPPVWVVKAKGFIDPCPLWDDDGKAYLSFATAGSRAGNKSIVLVAPLSPDGTALIGPSRIVYDGHETQPTIEGTKFYKHDGWYFIFSPAGGVATGWQTVLRARSPFGPFEERIVMSGGWINGPHQGGWVDTPEAENWFLHFQDKGAYGRIMHLQPMEWKDGWPVIGSDPDGDGCGEPVRSGTTPKMGEFTITQKAKPWKPYGIDLEWQFPAVPAPTWCFGMGNGDLRLFSVQQSGSWRNLSDTPNLLLQKFGAESFTVTAKLIFSPNPQRRDPGESAGFLVSGLDYAGLQITDTDQGPVLEFVTCRDALEGTPQQCTELAKLSYIYHLVNHSHASTNIGAVNYKDIGAVTVFVRLSVRPVPTGQAVPNALCTFSYSLDGKVFQTGGSFTAREGKWIGAKWGFFCNRHTASNDSGHLDILRLAVAE